MAEQVEHDLYCYRGQTFSQGISFTYDDTGEPIDLTGIDVRSHIRSEENTKALTAEFVVRGEPDQGYIKLILPNEVTETLRKGQYKWDLRMEDEFSDVAYYIKGKFFVDGRVTI